MPVSGVRRPHGPRFRERVRWGPPGWYCCDRLMAAAELGNGDNLRACRHCGVAILVSGKNIQSHVPSGSMQLSGTAPEQDRLPI